MNISYITHEARSVSNKPINGRWYRFGYDLVAKSIGGIKRGINKAHRHESGYACVHIYPEKKGYSAWIVYNT